MQDQRDDCVLGFVNDWEKSFLSDDGILIKIYLSINQHTQKQRFEIRKYHSLKYWKLSRNDIESLKKWDLYTYYKNEMFRKTSTKNAPWVIINAENKMTARLNAFRYIIDTIPYDEKGIIKKKSWNIDSSQKKIKLLGVEFNDLSKDQYDLLNQIKQIL